MNKFFKSLIIAVLFCVPVFPGDALQSFGYENIINSSSSGISTAQVDTYSLRTKYDPNQYVHFNMRAAREVSVEPNYISSELLGSIEIVL